MPSLPRVLFVTDLNYQARGRRYCDEDIELSGRLGDDFDLVLCHPNSASAFMDGVDVTVVRNSGPVQGYPVEWEAFRSHALKAGAPVFNSLDGAGDMAGKQYLVTLSDAGMPVMPTVDDVTRLPQLPEAARYVVKPKDGADSIGLTVVTGERLREIATLENLLAQPFIDFLYEVSFFYVGDRFAYALYAPDPQRRWELVPYAPTSDDLSFASGFVRWNSLSHGIQRVDACRTADGRLLLVELEDLNPYLSIDRLDEATKSGFVRMIAEGIAGLLR